MTELLFYGQRIEVCGLAYEVAYNHLRRTIIHERNSEAFVRVGITTESAQRAFANRYYGYDDTFHGDWPQSRHGDYAGLTRLVNALNALYANLPPVVTPEPEVVTPPTQEEQDEKDIQTCLSVLYSSLNNAQSNALCNLINMLWSSDPEKRPFKNTRDE